MSYSLICFDTLQGRFMPTVPSRRKKEDATATRLEGAAGGDDFKELLKAAQSGPSEWNRGGRGRGRGAQANAQPKMVVTFGGNDSREFRKEGHHTQLHLTIAQRQHGWTQRACLSTLRAGVCMLCHRSRTGGRQAAEEQGQARRRRRRRAVRRARDQPLRRARTQPRGRRCWRRRRPVQRAGR